MQATLCRSWFRQTVRQVAIPAAWAVLASTPQKCHYTILTDLQYVHLHAGLLHKRGACRSYKLARLIYGQLFAKQKPSCHVSELLYVLVQGYCMKQALLMNPDSMQDLLLGTSQQPSMGAGHTSFTSRRDWQSVTVSHSCSTHTSQASYQMHFLNVVYPNCLHPLQRLAAPTVSSTCCHALCKCFAAKKHVLVCVIGAAPAPHSCKHCHVVIGKCTVLFAAVRHVKAVTESPFRAVILNFDPRAIIFAFDQPSELSSLQQQHFHTVYSMQCAYQLHYMASTNMCPHLGNLCASDEHLCGDLLLSASFGLSFVHVMCSRNTISYPKSLLFISKDPF